MSRSALFVIDIQGINAIDPTTRIPHAQRINSAGDKILSTARQTIDSFRDKGEQSPSIIVFVQHEDESMVKGSDEWKLAFDPRDGVPEEVLVGKTTRNTFETNPGLAAQLQDQGIGEIVVFGIQSECCVLETSKGALGLGFSLTILQGAHSTYDSGPKSAADIERNVEETLRQAGAQVIPWEDAISGWQQRRMISSYPIFSDL